jgi:histidine ammonia-lyase
VPMGEANRGPVVLTGFDLTLEELVDVARTGRSAVLQPDTVERMRRTRAVIERALQRGEIVYGLSTGVGVNRRVSVDPADAADAGIAMLHEHRVGQGTPAPVEVVRGTMLRLANHLARGTPGVRPELAERLVEALNAGETPVVRRLGSVGQADLAALADLASGLFESYPLAPGESLALLDNNAFSTSWAALSLFDTGELTETLDVAGALSLEAFAANLQSVHEAVAAARPFPGLGRSLARIRQLLHGSAQWNADAARSLQDPLSFRSVPQVHGTLRDALGFAEGQLAIELNASQGNPIVVPEEDRLISVANFDAVPLAHALDVVRIAIASAVTSSCERAMKLLDASRSGLRTGLASGDDPASLGLAVLGVAAQALAVEARTLAQPVSHELASTTEAEGTEDRTSIASLGARRLTEQLDLAFRVLAIELAVAARALVLRPVSPMGGGTGRVLSTIREVLPWVEGEVATPPDVERLIDPLRSGLLADSPSPLDLS